MKKQLHILIAFFFLACTSEEPITPPDVLLNKTEMIGVIVDAQILEAHYNNLFQRKEVYANALDSATFFIFQDHDISKSIFEENLRYYSNQPDTLFQIYESALDTINNRINSGINSGLKKQ